MKKFEITKEQIVQAHNAGFIRIKQWFPEAFKKELEVGKWYKTNDGWLFNYQNDLNVYGFTPDGWSECSFGSWTWSKTNTNGVLEATPQEVENALINEAQKRYGIGSYVKSSNVCSLENLSVIKDYVFSFGLEFTLYNSQGDCIFNRGVWSEIIETITIQEAEKLLNKKIV